MIKRIPRHHLNIKKYTACLNQSVNYRIYAEFWYLDVLTNQEWDCFVYKDYEAVMPIPYQKKLGIKFIAQPIYCQQLGIFHSENLSEEVIHQFYKKFKTNLVRGYHFNEENQAILKLSNQKINQVIHLNTIDDLYIQKLRKDRKAELKKGLPTSFQIQESTIDKSFIKLLKSNYQEVEKELALPQLCKLAEEIQKIQKGITLNLVKEGEVVASNFYLNSGNRIIQLCNSSKSDLGFNTNTFLVDYMVRKYKGKPMIYDFEGSSLKGVNLFNSSFRATTNYFGIYKTSIFK